jgi:RNA polymerase sigma-70 factor, ECF subfamily
MTGSVIDGEDVVQEAFIKAFAASARSGAPANPEAWLFRIAHNAAMDFLRRRNRADATGLNEHFDAILEPEPATEELVERQESVATSLRLFMRLPAVQRSSVILMDVLDYSLAEIATIMESSLPAVKSALHRGRARLRELGQEPDDRPPAALDETLRSRLTAYVDRFNARDFEAIRQMISDEVRLELVNKTTLRGRQAANYFTNYASIDDWRLVAGEVEGQPAALVYEAAVSTTEPAYFVLLEWDGETISRIRDFRYARYASVDAVVTRGPQRPHEHC